MRRSILAVFLLVAGCATGAPATTPSPAAPTPTPAPTAAPTATAVVTAAPTSGPTSTPGTTAGYSCDPDMNYGCDSPTPSASAGSTGGSTVSLSADGSYLVGPNGLSLYVFDNDSPNHTACGSAGCAGAWPALTVAQGVTPVAGDGVTGTLTTFDRGGGVLQVQYNDRPLYFFSGDAAAGDTNGDGLNGVWHLAQT